MRDIIHPDTWVNALMVDYKLDDGIVREPISPENKAKYPIGQAPTMQQYQRDPRFPNWIITDVRYENEAQAIKDRGGIVIRVNRDLVIGGDDYGYTKVSVNQAEKDGIIKPQHESETALDNYTFDYVIENDGTLDELILKVKSMLKGFKLLA